MTDASGGLTFWQALVPLGAAAAILTLYFLKTRRRPVLVPSTLLWRRTIEDHRVNALWQRLRRSLLLLLQLAAVALAAIALLRPAWQGSQLQGGRYVFLIDNSASMATADVAPSRLAAATQRALDLIDKMGSGDSAMVVSFAASARVEESFTDGRERLRRAVREIRQTQETTSFDEALRLCAGRTRPTLGGDDKTAPHAPKAAQVFLFSDGNFADVGDEALAALEPVFVPIGTSTTSNLAVTRFAVRRSLDAPRRAQALARIRNFGTTPRETTVELRVEDRLLDARKLSLASPGATGAGETASGTSQHDVVFTVDDAPDGVWEVRIVGTDDLPFDDRAWALLAPPAKARLLVVTAGNRYLAAALATDEARTWCDATFEPPSFLESEGYRAAAAAGAYDAIVFDRCKPDVPPDCNTLYFGALPSGEGWRTESEIEVPLVFDTAQAHPLMQNVALGNVVIAAARTIAGPPGSQTLVESQAGALAVSVPRAGFDDVAFGFALQDDRGAPQTNWPLVDGAGFEQFILNAAQYFGRNKLGGAEETLRPGDSVTLPLAEGAASLAVVGPDGTRAVLPGTGRGEATFYDTRLLGPYRVLDGEQVQRRFVVNLFDVRESQPAVAADSKLRIGREEIAAQANWEASRWQGWRPFLLLVLAMLAGEWYIYGRRASL
jgi:hypothetical protein